MGMFPVSSLVLSLLVLLRLRRCFLEPGHLVGVTREPSLLPAEVVSLPRGERVELTPWGVCQEPSRHTGSSKRRMARVKTTFQQDQLTPSESQA